MIISKLYYRFFKQLAANNNRDWFQAHKAQYQSDVLLPFTRLTEEVIKKIHDINPTINIMYKDAAFRIYRDTRFSKDKTPYKLWMGAVVNPIGRKNTQFPEIYFQFGPGENFIAAGLYRPDKETLQKIRRAIAENPEAFDLLQNDPKMREFFPEGILGERNKRLPKEFMKIADKQPFILNKQFYTIAYYTPEDIMRNDLVDFIVGHYQAMEKFNEWLYGIVG